MASAQTAGVPAMRNSVGEHSIDEKHDPSEESSSAKGVAPVHHERPEEDELELYGEDAVFPTEEEVHTLRRIADKMPVAAFAIVIVELCERFAYYGASRTQLAICVCTEFAS